MKKIQLTRKQQFKQYEDTCKNKTLTEGFVSAYVKSTKNAMESILNMGEAVHGIYIQMKNNELNESDLGYFCMRVGLDPKSSTFRKYKAIGENSKKFREYANKLPGTFSVLYEIATLDPDQFENLMKNTSFANHLTLEQVKKLVSKPRQITSTQNTSPKISNQPMNANTVSRYIEGVNSFSIKIATDIDRENLKQIITTLVEYRNKNWIKFSMPKVLQSGMGITREDRKNDEDDLKFFASILIDSEA